LNFSFGEYWVWMLGIPICVGILFLAYNRVSQITLMWFSPDQYGRSYPLTKFILRAVAFIFLFIGLIGPYWGVEKRRVKSLGREIYFLMDVSASMNVNDVGPTRLERAKAEIRRLLPELEGDRVGLMLFTEHPFIQCPLTQDHKTFELFLNIAETGQFKQTGTQFRSVLAKVVDRLAESRAEQPEISQAVVLISDGEDFGDKYVSVIERLRRRQVKVFTVGIGTYEGGPVPAQAENRSSEFVRYQNGNVVISQLQDQRLREIASTFGTQYQSIKDDDDHLDQLASQIRELVASPLELRTAEVENNKYQVFLFISIILLFATLVIMPIRRE